MNQQTKTIDYKWLVEPTGDPFADAGGYALKEFSKRFPEKDILELIEEVTKIYVNSWNANIYLFFLNSGVTQSAFKGGKKITETMNYFQGMIEGRNSAGMGYCRITGQKTQLFAAKRNNSILSGSGEFLNFHHTFEAGIMVSKEILIRFHFVPLACVLLQGRVGLIQSNDNRLTELFAANNCSENLHALAMNLSDGMLKSKYRVPSTALFRFIDEALLKSQQEKEVDHCSLTLYHFSNRSTKPEIQIYSVPAVLFAFYAYTQKVEFKEEWNQFVGKYYRSTEFKGAAYNERTQQINYEKKGQVTQIDKEEYQCWSNIIYSWMLEGKSILPYIRSWSENHSFSLKIVEKYLTYIRNMKAETQKKILELADFMVEIEGRDRIGKCIQQIKNAKSSSALTRLLINRVLSKNMELKRSPILTVEEYCDYLFPEDIYWRDVRDVFLIGIYQKLHEKGICLNVVEAEIEEEEMDINE